MPADHQPTSPILRDSSLWGLTITQFLGAFNDNIFKQFVLLVCVAAGLQSQALAVFAFPFVLGSWLSGAISDRVSKRSLVVFCKVLEIAVMAAAVAVLILTPPDSDVRRSWLLVVLGFMALQSTLFGPSKYGLLPELFRGKDLPVANGVIQMTTFLAIILGTGLAGVLKARVPAGWGWVPGLVCVGIAIVGTLSALLIRPTPVAKPDLAIRLRSAWMDAEVWRLLKSDRLLLGVLLLTSIFWLLGSVLQPAVNSLGVQQMGWAEDTTSGLLVALSLGIAAGCVVAAKLSQGKADFPLARKAAAAMMVFFVGLAIVPELGLSDSAVYWLLMLLFALVGLSAGLFAVPLQTFVQTRPPAELKGRMIGTMNVANFGGIFLGAGVYAACEAIFGAGPSDPINRSFFLIGAVLLPVVILFRRPAETLSDEVAA